MAASAPSGAKPDSADAQLLSRLSATAPPPSAELVAAVASIPKHSDIAVARRNSRPTVSEEVEMSRMLAFVLDRVTNAIISSKTDKQWRISVPVWNNRTGARREYLVSVLSRRVEKTLWARGWKHVYMFEDNYPNLVITVEF